MGSKSIGYYVEDRDFEELKAINKALFGDGTHLTADRRRDLANMMFVVLSSIEGNPVYDED